LPSYEWGVADWHLDVIRPFVKKYKPTIGFSLAEASLAEKVTVIGNNQSFSEDQLDSLRATGSHVERISGDGTSIATSLQER
jgi:putative cell wall-binding protein